MDDKLRRFRLATARRLRSNQTSAEQRLWKGIDRIPLLTTHFRRQAALGPYVVDFACLRAKLIIELDGPSHTEPGAAQRDAMRTAWLESEGFKVLRFWNAEVYDNIDGVLDTIYTTLYGYLNEDPVVTPPRTAPQSDPPPQGEGDDKGLAFPPSPGGRGSRRRRGVG